MTSPTEITVTQLSRLIGLPGAPAIIDARIDEDFGLDPRLIPGSRRRGHQDIGRWAACYAARKVVVVCHRGQKLSQGVAALLRHEGIAAETLEGGFEAWAAADQPTIAAGLLAASLGLSGMYRDDLELLAASMMLYDALYRWCRDATEETHGRPPNKSASGA